MEEMLQETVPPASCSPQEPIQLKTTMITRVLARAVLERHGCLVGEGCVTLPLGSIRTLHEQHLQTKTLWYDIVLPDQYHLMEAYDPCKELSILFWLPERVRAKRRNA